MDRAFEIASTVHMRAPNDGLAHPFGLDKPYPYRWRVSQDVWAALVAHVGFGDPDPITTPPGSRLLGDPIELDRSLPPSSMLLEPEDRDRHVAQVAEEALG